MERYYQIAGLCIRVELPEEVPFSGDGPLGAFVTERGSWDCEMIFRVVPELSAPVGKLLFAEAGKRIYATETGMLRYDGAAPDSVKGAVTRISREGNRSLIQVRQKSIPGGITAALILNTMEIDHLITRSEGVILHSAYIIHKGGAIVFTAPSGTGKSTQAALWERFRGAQVVNGDRSILMPEEDRVMAHGLPFSGSSGICENSSAPLRAVVYLSQGPENVLRRLRGMDCFRCLWEGCNLCRWDEEEMELAANTVMKILGRVPVYHLACRPDEAAVRTLEQVLYQKTEECL